MSHTSHYTYSDPYMSHVIAWAGGRWVESSLDHMAMDENGRIVMDPETATRPVYVRAIYWRSNSHPRTTREVWTPRGGWRRVPGLDHAIDIARMEQDTP